MAHRSVLASLTGLMTGFSKLLNAAAAPTPAQGLASLVPSIGRCAAQGCVEAAFHMLCDPPTPAYI